MLPRMRRRRVAVVGAGAAGLTAAIRAAEGGAQVTLLNAHPRIGLKILMSGGTRCNVTHREVDARDYNGGSHPFVARILRAFTPAETIEWMTSLGVKLKLEDTGKYFPESDDAETVLDALLAAVGNAGVDVRYGARVVRLERAGEWSASGRCEGVAGAWRLGVQHVAGSAAFGAGVRAMGEQRWPLPDVAVDEWIEADAVILATGGLSFPRTGSDGTGYALAASGSFLFAHFGYSGPAALDLSRHWLRAEGERRVTASFVPGMAAEALEREWTDAAKAEPRLSARRFLARHMPDSLAAALATEAGVEPAKWISQVDRARRAALIARVAVREMPITGTLGYEKAEATAGGVTLSEVDASTLESRKAPGVYLCGEMLDVEGRLGGFNFQWAWSSGTVAGRCAGRMS